MKYDFIFNMRNPSKLDEVTIYFWMVNQFLLFLINFQNPCSNLHTIEALENAKAADGLRPEVWVTGLPLKAAGESILVKDQM